MAERLTRTTGLGKPPVGLPNGLTGEPKRNGEEDECDKGEDCGEWYECDWTECGDCEPPSSP